MQYTRQFHIKGNVTQTITYIIIATILLRKINKQDLKKYHEEIIDQIIAQIIYKIPIWRNENANQNQRTHKRYSPTKEI